MILNISEYEYDKLHDIKHKVLRTEVGKTSKQIGTKKVVTYKDREIDGRYVVAADAIVKDEPVFKEYSYKVYVCEIPENKLDLAILRLRENA